MYHSSELCVLGSYTSITPQIFIAMRSPVSLHRYPAAIFNISFPNTGNLCSSFSVKRDR